MQRFRFKIFTQYLWLALFVVLMRVVFKIFFDKFSVDTLLLSAVEGLKLALWVIGFGLLNAIIDFRRLLPKSPRFLKSITTALNISLALTPEIVRSLDRIKSASKLRAHRRGIHLVRSLLIPVISDAIDQAINLGDSMSSRGYGAPKSHDQSNGSIEISDVSFSYGGEAPVLKQLNLWIPSGALVLVTGKTGSGKSTLLKVIQARKPDCAFVNQFPRDGFVADKVSDEIAFALVQQGLGRSEIDARVSDIADTFELQDVLGKDPQALSAGFQQRVAIAAALIAGSKVLLLDEPFSALDEASSKTLLDALVILKTVGITVIIAEHRFEMVSQIADLKFTLQNGHLVTHDPATRKLVRSVNNSGSITALFGANGSGKTTYLHKIASERGVLVPQPASDLLFLNTVDEELSTADSDSKQPTGTASRIFHNLVGKVAGSQNPRDLSQGQKLALAISVQLSKTSNPLMLDEPTLGFDFDARQTLVELLGNLSSSGIDVIVATHDREFAEAIATRTQIIRGGVLTNV
ncbi:MAG: hypothetical protein RL197_1268 [Actinomycetota bacterium]